MSKNSAKGYAALGIVFALVSTIAFTVPAEKMAAFWIAYAFTAAAFIAQIGIWKIGFGKDETLKSKFLGLPLIHVGTGYLIVQMIVFFVFLFVPALPAWSAVLICTIITGISALCMISADAGRGEIERIEEKVKQKVFYIRGLQADVELMADRETDAVVKDSLTQLAEKIRFSDPMSNEHLAELENQISDKISELKSMANRMETIVELNSLLDERNKKCKMQK